MGKMLVSTKLACASLTSIEEGVDVLSLSIGGLPGFVVPFFTDDIAIGAFTAVQKGIFVSCSASNSGPANSTLLVKFEKKVLETCSDQQREFIMSRIKVHLTALKKYTYGKHIVARVEKLVAAGERRIAQQNQHPSA